MTKHTSQTAAFLAIAGLALGVTGCCSFIWTSACPPKITTQPKSQLVPEGTVVSFSVVVAKPPHVFYQWQFNGSNIFGATNATYTIPHPVNFPDVGEYRVRVWGSPTNTSKSAFLSV